LGFSFFCLNTVCATRHLYLRGADNAKKPLVEISMAEMTATGKFLPAIAAWAYWGGPE